jgi:D-alanine-D-alanine ligase
VAEFDSAGTIAALEQTLQTLGYTVERIGNGLTLAQQLAAGKRWDLVFNFAEGVSGRSREAQVPAQLELYGVPYTFSDPLVSALTLDKAMTKQVISPRAVRRFSVVASSGDIKSVNLTFPCSPFPGRNTGKGPMSTRIDRRGLGGLRALLKVPPAGHGGGIPPGREFGPLGTGHEAEVLGQWRSPSAKGRRRPTSPLSSKSSATVGALLPMPKGALCARSRNWPRAYRVLECRDTARVDIRLDAQGRPAFIEINPLPGLHPTHSDLPMIATQEGMAYEELLRRI